MPGLARTIGESVVSTAAGVYSPVIDRALAAGAVARAQQNAATMANARSAVEIRRRITVGGQFGRRKKGCDRIVAKVLQFRRSSATHFVTFGLIL